MTRPGGLRVTVLPAPGREPQAPPAADPSSLALGALEDSLGFLLRIAQLQAFERFYAAVAGHDLRAGAFTILWVIGLNPGVRQGVLAERLMIKRAHMAKLIRALELAGLVARTPSREDRRAVELRLTPAGRRHVELHAAAFFAPDSAPPPGLSAAETRTLIGLLRKLTGIGEEAP